MDALELADQLTAEWNGEGFQPDTSRDATAMLRKQNEAIRQLREALEHSVKYVPELADVPGIKAALAATEEICKN